MSSMSLDHRQLVNLEQSLNREFLRSNRAGAFASSSLVYCNTRKNHGLLNCPIDELDGDNYVLLSALDETIILEGQEFHLGIHKYPNVYHPLGHKYIESLGVDPTPYVIYKIGSIVLKKETILSEETDQIMFRYTLLESPSNITLRFQPYLAFRSTHSLTRENFFANTHYEDSTGGVKFKMYEGYPDLHLQLSKKHEYIHAPGWFYNIEYLEDQKAEQPFQEDLFVPGFFELNLKLGETIIFSASTKEEQFASLRSKFTQEVKKRIPRNTFENCLINAAQQFIKTRNNKTEVIAGYPSFGVSGRDALIALPGITLYTDGSESIFLDAFDNLTSELNNDIFAALAKKGRRSADIPLWYIWTLQEYVNYKQSSGGIWKKYGGILTEILNTYRNGVDSQIYMTENKLIWASQPGMPLTWMDLIVDGVPMTQRAGYAVEVNALWYNAVCFALDIAKKAKAKEFVSEWKDYPEQIAGSFETIFWNEQQRYLYDFVNEKSDPSIRPNMLFAVSLPFSPLKTSQKSAVIDTVRNHLFTKKGLRTLSPRNPNYNGMPSENRQHARMVYHQGNIFPWLGGHFVTAQLNLKGKAGLPDALMFYHEFEKEMTRKGMGTISEYFHGNPPHEGRGAISQAWNTAELLRLKHTLLKYQD